MLSWRVVDKDDKENSDGTEGLSVILKDSHGDEIAYTVEQTTFDGLHVGKSYTLALTPIDEPVQAAVAAPVAEAAPDPAPAPATETAPVTQ